MDIGKFKTPGLRNIALTAPFTCIMECSAHWKKWWIITITLPNGEKPGEYGQPVATAHWFYGKRKKDLVAFETLTDRKYITKTAQKITGLFREYPFL